MDLGNDRRVNSVIPAEKRRVPFSNMVYIGDGETDIPCMQVIKDAGGLSIAVYDPENRKKKNIEQPDCKAGKMKKMKTRWSL